MHIVHIVTRLLRAGSEENTISTCVHQANAGHRVTLVHGAEFDPFWYDAQLEGIELIGLPEMVHPVNIAQDFRAYFQLKKLYRNLKPDVIHTHQSKAGILGRLAAKVVPNTIVVHGIHILSWEGLGAIQHRLFILLERLAARQTDVFIAVSKAMGHAFEDAGVAAWGSVHCVRSGMDLARFRQASNPKDWRDLVGVPMTEARPRIALMMAAFEPRKRHAAFLRAFAKAAHKAPDMKVLLAGQGPDEQKIRTLVSALGLQDRVVFCGHRPDPEALLALADLLVLTSEREGLPRVVIQALASAVPVVVNEVPGICEVIQSGRNGIVVPPHDVSRAVYQMIDLIQSDSDLDQLILGALDTDISDWELDHLGACTTRLYQRTANTQADVVVLAE